MGLHIQHQQSALECFHHPEQTPRTPEPSPPRPRPFQAREPATRCLWTGLFWTRRIHGGGCHVLCCGGLPSRSTFPGSTPAAASVRRPPSSFPGNTPSCGQTAWHRPFVCAGHSGDPRFGGCARAVVSMGVSAFPSKRSWVPRALELPGHVATLSGHPSPGLFGKESILKTHATSVGPGRLGCLFRSHPRPVAPKGLSCKCE